MKFQDLNVDLNAVSHQDEKKEETEVEIGESESLEIGESESPVTFFLQTGNTFHTPSYFKVKNKIMINYFHLSVNICFDPLQ